MGMLKLQVFVVIFFINIARILSNYYLLNKNSVSGTSSSGFLYLVIMNYYRRCLGYQVLQV